MLGLRTRPLLEEEEKELTYTVEQLTQSRSEVIYAMDLIVYALERMLDADLIEDIEAKKEAEVMLIDMKDSVAILKRRLHV